MATQADQFEQRLTALEAARTQDNQTTQNALTALESATNNKFIAVGNKVAEVTMANQAVEQDLADTKTKVEQVIAQMQDIQNKTTQDIQAKFDQAIQKIEQTFA